MRITSACLLSVTVLATAAPRRVEACSFESYVSRRSVQPADGSTAVPLNAEIRIEYAGPTGEVSSLDLEDILLRPAGGAPIALEVVLRQGAGRAVVVGRPAAALAPATVYEILDRWTEGPCDDDVACIAEDHALVGTFTTGDAADAAPPVFAGLSEVTGGDEPEICDDSACCGPNTSLSFGFVWDPATDETPAGELRYDLYGPGDALVQPLLPQSSVYARGYRVCSGDLIPNDEDGYFAVEPGFYTVRAVDLAGNVDDNEVQVEVLASCGEQAGGDGEEDGVEEDRVEEDRVEEDGGAGCSSAATRGDLGDALGGTAFLLLVALSRSRSGRPRRCRPAAPRTPGT
jgi:hypothetical protein